MTTARSPFSPTALALACAALCLGGPAAAQSGASDASALLKQLQEQRQLLDQQRQELERQRGQLEQQQKQLESLAAALEQPRAAPQPAGGGWGQGPAVASAGGSAAPGTDEPLGLTWSGYADLNYQRYDFF